MARGVDFDFYDPNRVAAAKPAAPPAPKFKPLNFECCECGETGLFGEDVALLKGREGTWYCAKHVPAHFFDHLKEGRNAGR